MANYVVFLEGNDFELTSNGHKEVVGFFITVRVEAQTEEVAAEKAIEVVKADPCLAEAFAGGSRKSPRIEAKVVHELPAENKMKNTDFQFFPMVEK